MPASTIATIALSSVCHPLVSLFYYSLSMSILFSVPYSLFYLLLFPSLLILLIYLLSQIKLRSSGFFALFWSWFIVPSFTPYPCCSGPLVPRGSSVSTSFSWSPWSCLAYTPLPLWFSPLVLFSLPGWTVGWNSLFTSRSEWFGTTYPHFISTPSPIPLITFLFASLTSLHSVSL